MLDIFNSDAFKFREMLTAINRIPHEPRQVMSLGIFQEVRKTSDLIAVEVKAGTITLLKETSRHGVPEAMDRERGELFPFQIKARKQRDTLYADEIFKAREFGTEDMRKTIERERDLVLARMRMNHDATREQRYMGALRGLLLDSDGVTVLHNYFQEFGVTPPATVFLDVANSANGALFEKVQNVVRSIAASLGGTTYRSIHALCGPTFYTGLIKNAEVRDSFHRQNDSAFLRDDKVFSSFFWGGINWEEYRGNASLGSYVADDQALVFPTGVPDMYLEAIAPAPWLDTVGTLGLPYYAKSAVDPKYQAFIEMESQSHTLAMVTRPEALRLLDKDAA